MHVSSVYKSAAMHGYLVPQVLHVRYMLKVQFFPQFSFSVVILMFAYTDEPINSDALSTISSPAIHGNHLISNKIAMTYISLTRVFIIYCMSLFYDDKELSQLGQSVGW